MKSKNKVWKQLRKKNGVAGFSGKPKKKIIDGKEVDEESLRVYVEKKL